MLLKLLQAFPIQQPDLPSQKHDKEKITTLPIEDHAASTSNEVDSSKMEDAPLEQQERSQALKEAPKQRDEHIRELQDC